MNIFLLYLWTRLDALNAVFVLMAVVVVGTALISAGLYISASLDEDEFAKKIKPLLVKSSWLAGALLTVSVFLPTQKDAAIIAGGWAVEQLATSEGAQQLGSKTFALINGKLDEELAKLQPKEEKQ